jgi:hypothetical protein
MAHSALASRTIRLAAAAFAALWSHGADAGPLDVAVIDSGLDPRAAIFDGRVDPNSIDIITGGSSEDGDPEGHGTDVSSIIVTHSSADVLAVRTDAPGSCRSGGGCAFFDRDIAKATTYALAQGARVLNFSLGGEGKAASVLVKALGQAARDGVVLVFAAGNDSLSSPGYPGRLAASKKLRGDAIVVGAVTGKDTLASFSDAAGKARSNYLVAPGTSVPITGLDGVRSVGDGTSFSSPQVAAAAASLLARSPDLTGGEVVARLLDSATDLGAAGVDKLYGHGLLNASAALSDSAAVAAAQPTAKEKKAAARSAREAARSARQAAKAVSAAANHDAGHARGSHAHGH